MERSPGLPDQWVTIRDAAERFGVTPHTVNRWARDGKLPVIEMSRRSRYVDWAALSVEMRQLADDQAAGRRGDRRQPDSSGATMRLRRPDEPSGS